MIEFLKNVYWWLRGRPWGDHCVRWRGHEWDDFSKETRCVACGRTLRDVVEGLGGKLT